jgi:hypothetical protein
MATLRNLNFKIAGHQVDGPNDFGIQKFSSLKVSWSRLY